MPWSVVPCGLSEAKLQAGRLYISVLRLAHHVFHWFIMYLRAALAPALAVALALPATWAKQVPVVEGVIGGVSSAQQLLAHIPSPAKTPSTPGKLRVTENSGVCGKHFMALH